MEASLLLEIIKLALSMAILPALYWAWRTQGDIRDLQRSQRELRDANSKEHMQVISELKELRHSINLLDKQNQQEHGQFNDRIHELNRQISIDQAINGLKN